MGQPVRVLTAIVIDVERPITPSGGHLPKATVGEAVPVVATLVKEGHDLLAAALHWSAPSGARGKVPLRPGPDDRWSAVLRPTEPGRHELTIVAWNDRFATWG